MLAHADEAMARGYQNEVDFALGSDVCELAARCCTALESALPCGSSDETCKRERADLCAQNAALEPAYCYWWWYTAVESIKHPPKDPVPVAGAKRPKKGPEVPAACR